MGSLNGDIVVMRNGRSTSQISVYNYPEHLNPFYEDDQHKRLRFWKISKNDKEERRNSFSFGNLRDMWSFKPFKSRKKSSTLGITKTSESPPTLRREFAPDNGWNTFDNRLRQSTTSSINGDNFQRNATYRSSLQTLPTNTDRIGFNRNDDYRSTIQVPRPNPRYHRTPHKSPAPLAPRYVYGGSATPQPMRNNTSGSQTYDSYNNNANMIRGSSISSMGSTNPFDSDGDEDSAMRSINGGSTSTLSKSAARKKRRAPAPPTPINGRVPTINIESSQNNTQNDELCIREDTDIANLTAEIQSFVHDKSNEDIEKIPEEENVPQVSRAISISNNVHEHVEPTAATKVDITTKTTTTTTQISPIEVPRAEVAKQPVEVVSVEVVTKTKGSAREVPKAEVTKPVKVVSVEMVTKSKGSEKEVPITEVSKPVEVVSVEVVTKSNGRLIENKKANVSQPMGGVVSIEKVTKSKGSPTVDSLAKQVEIGSVDMVTTTPSNTVDNVKVLPKVYSPTPAKRHMSNVTTAAVVSHSDASPSSEIRHKNSEVRETIKSTALISPKQKPQTNGSVIYEGEKGKQPSSRIVATQEVTKNQTTVTSVREKPVQSEIVIKEIKSNGAIPKKSNNMPLHTQQIPGPVDPPLNIKETNDQQERPTPVKRSAKTDITEHGQVECIHIHVSSPKTTPRQDHGNNLSSFRQDHHNDTAEIITTKTPFILTSPPTPRKHISETKQTKEIVQIPGLVKSDSSFGIAKEEENSKPEIKSKPSLSPKPIIDRNGKVNNFAEIHKPMRSKVSHTTANGHVKRVSIEEQGPSPPTVPRHQINEQFIEQEKQLKSKGKVVAFDIKSNRDSPVRNEVETENLQIVETSPAYAENRSNESSCSSSMPSRATATSNCTTENRSNESSYSLPSRATATSNCTTESRSNESSCSSSMPTRATAISNSTAVTLSSEPSDSADFESLFRPSTQSHMEWKRSTLAPLETNIPPEKRKSVKDIIESINRSQRLLHAAANKDFTIMTGNSTEASDQNLTHEDHLRIMEASQREIKRIVRQIDETTAAPPSYSECMGAESEENSKIFQKCKVNKEVYDFRETSPITSNLDWNPVPKPKRAKAPNE